jgi:hypothetical protein
VTRSRRLLVRRLRLAVIERFPNVGRLRRIERVTETEVLTMHVSTLPPPVSSRIFGPEMIFQATNGSFL